MSQQNTNSQPSEFDREDWSLKLSQAKTDVDFRALIMELPIDQNPDLSSNTDLSIDVDPDEQVVRKSLEAYARMMNMLDPYQLEPLLEDDFGYASQNVFEEITSKSQFMAYITRKLKTLATFGGDAKVWAELGYLKREFPGPCVVLAQGGKDDLIAVVLAKVKDGRLLRLDLCVAPSPWSAIRSGIYPNQHAGTFKDIKHVNQTNGVNNV